MYKLQKNRKPTSNLGDVMKIPQMDSKQFELPFIVNDGNLETGIPESYIVNPINTYIRKYEGRLRDTETEIIDVTNLVFLLREGGFTLKGDVQVGFRKLLSEAPLLGKIYTPSVKVDGSFVEELEVNVVNGKLNVSHSQLYLSTSDIWYKKLFDEFVLPSDFSR